MTKILANITLEASPESVEHVQQVLDGWTRFNPLEIEVLEIKEE